MIRPLFQTGTTAIFFLSLLVNLTAAPLARVANTTLTNVPPSPPTFGYSSANAFGTLTFTNPVCIVTPPGETNRLFILEKRGRVIVITNLANPIRTVFMDITSRVTTSTTDSVSDERGLLGLAFHPGYATNRFFYLFYTGTATTATPGVTKPMHDILARFETSEANTNQGLEASEVRLLMQYDQANNHNAGDLHFGPDGYLYVSLGDEGDGNDTRQNSQWITKDFFSGILRLDVDKRAGSLTPNPHPSVTTNYLVPPDNPFIGATNFNGSGINSNLVHTEFWAVGLRNPWRMFFDRETGTLYIGDVGQGGSATDSREEIDIGVKGANYGWNYWEGNFQRAVTPVGFVHRPPLFDYPWGSAAAVTGGVLYRGQRLSQLYGAYVFADYVNGTFRALRHSGNTVRQALTLNLNDTSVVAFGLDPRNGDILYADVTSPTASTIKRLNYNTTTNGAPLPPTLAAANVFSDLTNLIPHAGIVPYDLNLPFWSDNAIKNRWFSVPNTNLTIGFAREGNWSFPTGTVWIKHFELELTNGVPASRKRLETRLLVKNASGGYGITYRWGNSLTNATLVPEEGMNEAFVINDGGNLRTQVWHYPSRVECLQCHTVAGGFALGFNSSQLNRDFDYSGTVTNQIAALSDAGYFNTNVNDIHTLRALVPPDNHLASLESRARSYLAANCAQCHQPAGPAQALWDARVTTRTADAGLVNGALVNSGGDTNNRVLVPGSISNSVLLARIAMRGAGQMPPLASTLVDTQGVALIAAWITNDLPSFQTYTDWQLAQFGSTNSPESGLLADPDGDGAINRLESLTGTNPTNALEAWRIAITLSNDVPMVEFPQVANRGFEVQSAPSLLGPTWTPLNVPANAPFFSVSNRNARVPDLDPATDSRYYRVRVFEP